MSGKRNITGVGVLLVLAAAGLAWLRLGPGFRPDDAASPGASEPALAPKPSSQERPLDSTPTGRSRAESERSRPGPLTSPPATKENRSVQALTTEEMLESFVLEMELGDGPDVPPKGQHTRFLQEDRDETWAAPVEYEIQQAIAEFRAKGDHLVEVPRIECRATLCEVWGAEYLTGQGGSPEWYEVMYSIKNAEWARGEFAEVQTAMKLLPDGSVGLVTFLVRAPDPAE